MAVNHFIPGDEFRAVGLEVFLTSERMILTSRGKVRRDALRGGDTSNKRCLSTTVCK